MPQTYDNKALGAFFDKTLLVSSVSTKPGEIELTSILYFASSIDEETVKPFKAYFEME